MTPKLEQDKSVKLQLEKLQYEEFTIGKSSGYVIKTPHLDKDAAFYD